MREVFHVDEVLDHPTFGIGLVTLVREDKIDVAFKSFAKTLSHARGAPHSAPEKAPATGEAPSGNAPQS